MIYEWVHEVFSTLLIDYSLIPNYLHFLIIFFELYAVYYFFMFCLYPFAYVVRLVIYGTKKLLPLEKKRNRRSGDYVE